MLTTNRTSRIDKLFTGTTPQRVVFWYTHDMKTITLRDEAGDYKVNIVFCIFDIRKSMLSSDYEVGCADNATHALKYYNKAFGLTDKYKRADGYEGGASICVYKNYWDKNGIRYKIGKRTWYRIV